VPIVGLVPPIAVTNGDVILIVVFIAIPVAAIFFALGAGGAFRSIGKGGLSVEFDSDIGEGMRDSGAEPTSAGEADAELRQLLEAKAYRQSARGEDPLDVDTELGRLRAEQRSPAVSSVDPGLRDEVRQLVVARNERRARQGKEPLDVETEIARQLRDLENLGQ
jgi:hypothetical protein